MSFICSLALYIYREKHIETMFCSLLQQTDTRMLVRCCAARACTSRVPWFLSYSAPSKNEQNLRAHGAPLSAGLPQTSHDDTRCCLRRGSDMLTPYAAVSLALHAMPGHVLRYLKEHLQMFRNTNRGYVRRVRGYKAWACGQPQVCPLKNSAVVYIASLPPLELASLSPVPC